MRKKPEPIETPKDEHCKCDEPDLIDTISVGVNGYFSFCKRCRLERRMTQQEIDERIRIAKYHG